jgi:hypothetical protein
VNFSHRLGRAELAVKSSIRRAPADLSALTIAELRVVEAFLKHERGSAGLTKKDRAELIEIAGKIPEWSEWKKALEDGD